MSKFKDTDNRVHSYFHLKGTFKDAVASEGDGLVFYNIEIKEDKHDHIMAVDLNGPDVYIKSTNREVAYETEIEVRNKRETQKFDILVEFERLVKKGGVSHRKLGAEIKNQVYENVEKFTYWHGPVWKMTYGGKAGSIVQSRIGDKQLLVQENTADGEKILSIDTVEYCNGRTFMLA